MIVDVRIEVEHIKRDVERAVRALKSAIAVDVLRRTLEDAGVLPSALGVPGTGSGESSLADSVKAEPAESFESLRFRGAYELALAMLEQEHLRRSRLASILLSLCVVSAIAAIALVASAFVRQQTTTLVMGVAGLMPAAAFGFWYRYASRIAERVRDDLRTLAKVELRRP